MGWPPSKKERRKGRRKKGRREERKKERASRERKETKEKKEGLEHSTPLTRSVTDICCPAGRGPWSAPAQPPLPLNTGLCPFCSLRPLFPLWFLSCLSCCSTLVIRKCLPLPGTPLIHLLWGISLLKSFLASLPSPSHPAPSAVWLDLGPTRPANSWMK